MGGLRELHAHRTGEGLATWTTDREACLTMLATTNNYNAWLEFEEPLGTNPVQTMAECAMARDLMDYCADVVYELDAEEYGE